MLDAIYFSICCEFRHILYETNLKSMNSANGELRQGLLEICVDSNLTDKEVDYLESYVFITKIPDRDCVYAPCPLLPA